MRIPARASWPSWTMARRRYASVTIVAGLFHLNVVNSTTRPQLSTVSKPETEAGAPATSGTVKIAYCPYVLGIGLYGQQMDAKRFFLEVPTEQPGTYGCDFGNYWVSGDEIAHFGSKPLHQTRALVAKSLSLPQGWPVYWIDNPVTAWNAGRFLKIPALMPPEYVNGTSMAFGSRISDTAPINHLDGNKVVGSGVGPDMFIPYTYIPPDPKWLNDVP